MTPSPQPQQEETSVPLPSKNNVKIAVIGFCLIILLAGMFYFGAYYTCKGNGELDGLKCKRVEIIGACEIEGKLYHQPEELDNSSWIIKPLDKNVTV